MKYSSGGSGQTSGCGVGEGVAAGATRDVRSRAADIVRVRKACILYEFVMGIGPFDRRLRRDVPTGSSDSLSKASPISTVSEYCPRFSHIKASSEGNQVAATWRAILASVRATALRAVRDSSGVAGRKPCFFKMRSHSATVIKGPVNLPVRSMREEVGKVVFGVLLNVADGIIKCLVVGHGRAWKLAAQALGDPEHIAVRESVRGVVTGDAMNCPGDFGEKNNAEGCGFSCNDVPPCEYASAGEPLIEFLFRHRRENAMPPCTWESRSAFEGRRCQSRALMLLHSKRMVRNEFRIREFDTQEHSVIITFPIQTP